MDRARLAALVLLPALLLALWALSRRGSSASAPRAEGHDDDATLDASARGDDGLAPRDAATTPIARTVHDRAVRDAVRRQIFLAWSRASEAPAAQRASPTPDPLRAPMPTLDGGAVDPDYLRARIREDFLPMAQQCFDQWQGRAPGAPGGRVVTDFVIVGDEHVGGVVDEVTLESGERDAGADAGVLGDREFQTCMRESMMAMAFQPPPGRGRLRVRYPFRFEPGDDGGR